MKAPTGEWKSVLGFSLVAVSLACWIYVWMKKYGNIIHEALISNYILTLLFFIYISVYPPLPHTLAPENQQAQLERMINMQVNPIEGLASRYDYEKGKWKE